MKLNSISIRTVYKHEHQFEFNIQSWCVQEQYWSYLKNYDSGQYRRVIVRVDDASKEQDDVVDETSIDVIALNKYFNIELFLKLDNIDKKKSLLELLHYSMIYLSREYKWDTKPLVIAYQQCLNSGIEYRFKVKDKLFKSPSKKFVGYAECFWDIERLTVIGKIESKEGFVIKEDKLIDGESYKREFIYYCNCKWDDEYTFSLYSKEGKQWSIGILSIV